MLYDQNEGSPVMFYDGLRCEKAILYIILFYIVVRFIVCCLVLYNKYKYFVLIHVLFGLGWM